MDSKKRRYYVKFIWFMSAAILVTCGALLAIIVINIRLNFITIGSKFWNPNVLVLIFLVGAISVGLFFSMLVAGIFLKPINELSDATRKVAKGDFNVEIKTKLGRDSEMGELIYNFNEMIRDLRSMETLRDDFIANVSHEFKTPLSTIQGYSTLLQDENLSHAEREAYTRYIIEATKQLSSLTSNILKLSKLENGELIEEKKNFDVAEQIRQAILFMEAQWTIKSIDFDIELAPAEVSASEDLFMQVWLNVIGTAIKFSDYAGRIIVRGERAGGKYSVTVRDFGCGMDEDTVRRIFEKFYQGDNSRSKEGNGLGLSLVKKILEVYGGEISVESEFGKGSTFIISVPTEKSKTP